MAAVYLTIQSAPAQKQKPGYNPDQPRDKDGKWVETGASVRNTITRAVGTVLAHIPGTQGSEAHFSVRLADGSNASWERSAVQVVRNPDGSAPSVNAPSAPQRDGAAAAALAAIRGVVGRQADTPTLSPLPDKGRTDGSGTSDDPIDVGSDLARAAKLLADGKHIRLSQPDQVATLLDKLRETVEDARARGNEAPSYDLCKVSVPKTNLFCQQSKNIPRAQMPQFRGEIVPGSPAEATRRANGRGNIEPLFREALARLGLPIRRDTMPASHLRASQSELDGVKVAQMAAAMERGDVPDAPIFVSRDGYVIDGHHRWAAKVALDTADNRLGDVDMDVEIVDMDIGAAIDYAGDFARAMGIAPKVHGQYVPDHPSTLADAVSAIYLPPTGEGPLGSAISDVYASAQTSEAAGILTEAQQIAAKQKWKLPTGPIAELQAQQAAVVQADTPSVADLVDQGMSAAEATKEAKRLARNAQVNAWRQRMKLQAAIDTVLAKDKAQGATGLQKATADGQVDGHVAAGPGGLSLPSEPAGAPPAPPLPEEEAAALDYAFLKSGEAGPPKALYTVPKSMQDQAGPGGITYGHAWHDQLLQHAGQNSDPIPVVHLNVQGAYTVESGWAQTIGGRAYLVESMPGESAEDAGKRMHEAAALVQSTLAYVPSGHQSVQRGYALLAGPNPQDGHWADTYGIEGFTSTATGGNGTTTFFNGSLPDPGVIAHEFGHNADSNSVLSSQWLSTIASPTMPGQAMSWGDARNHDAAISDFYTGGRFVETRAGKPIILGSGGVTDYAASSPKEDFAESVRLWMRDQRYEKVGYDPITGDNIRFADLFPERAKILALRFGVPVDLDTAARKRRYGELKADIKKQAINAHGTGGSPPWEAAPASFVTTAATSHGLDRVTASTAFTEALDEVKADLAAAEAKKAAVAAAKEKAEAAKAAKLAADQVKNFEEAFTKGLISKSERDKLTGRRRARAYHLRAKGVPEDQAMQQALAWEQAYIAEHWPPRATVSEPWIGQEMTPDFTESGVVGDDFIAGSGSTVHHLAKKQSAKPQQAKANISAELASRMNNPDDWEVFRQYATTRPLGLGGARTIGEFDTYTEEERQAILDQESSARVDTWAGTSGDADANAVVMQMAAKDEFGLDSAHPAPTMDQDTYEKWQAMFYTAEVEAFHRRYLRIMYEHTQEEFAAAGITHLNLHRGMIFQTHKVQPDWAKPDGKAKRPQLQPINSWSSSRSTSQEFSSSGMGGVIFEASVPVGLIVGSARTGFGCYGEFEFVVMDAEGLAKANNYSGAL